MRSHPLYHVKSSLFAALVVAMSLVLPTTDSAGQSAPADHDEVTFSKDIAPILQRSCQHCHQPDSVAPMSLITYEDADGDGPGGRRHAPVVCREEHRHPGISI